MSRLTFIMGLSVATLLIALALQYQQQSAPKEQGSQRENKNESDFYITSTTTNQYDKLGNLHYQFKAHKLEHFPKGDYTLVSAPDMTLYHRDGTPWRINSLMGKITADHKLIKLWDNVELLRETPREPLLMETQALTINPDQEIASTDRDVVITSKSGQVDATGMKVYIDENRMELLSNVRVRHEPIKLD